MSSTQLATALILLTAGAAFPSDLSPLPFLKTYTAERASSTDKTGANDDGNWKNPIKPGEQRTIAQLEGPGIITHMWFTISTPERYHLKKIVLRMFWDDDPLPAVETPIGDFFGLGLGEYFLYESGPLSVGSQKALNCYFPMPFRKSARITITNEGQQNISAFYYNIDWQKHKSLPETSPTSTPSTGRRCLTTAGRPTGSRMATRKSITLRTKTARAITSCLRPRGAGTTWA
jgi:Protein of unknown function (DUF2961).